MFEGTYTALVTPFVDGRVDFDSFGALIDAQMAAGVDGIVPCGSTGESATLSHREHEEVIAYSIERAAKKLKVIAGTGSNSTAESVKLTRFAADKGADGALLIAPYYNKPTQDGLYAHYRAVAESSALPILTYNIPGRSAVNILPETLARLAEVPNIVGVKEASGSLDQVSRVLELCGPDFTVLSGDDSLTLPMMSVGAHGVISTTGNVLPGRMQALVRAAARGDYASARKIHFELLPTMRALFVQTNPIPVKTALALMGRVGEEIRLPLTPMPNDLREQLATALRAAGLLS